MPKPELMLSMKQYSLFNQWAYLFRPNHLGEAQASQDTWDKIKKLHTNVYVWGEGFQVDSSQEYSNFTPKKIKPFTGEKTPDIVDMAFGWYHEAYIDKQGKLYVCAKAKMSSIKILEVPDFDWR